MFICICVLTYTSAWCISVVETDFSKRPLLTFFAPNMEDPLHSPHSPVDIRQTLTDIMEQSEKVRGISFPTTFSTISEKSNINHHG
jgi:hypothetical protein